MTGRYHTLQIGSWADSVGRENVANVFAEFDCSKNADIDGFLKNNAVDFARRQISVSHLVFDSATRACLGYFTLTHKPLSLEADKLSATVRRRIERFAKCRSGNDIRTYTLSAFLIAQIGKNFKIPEPQRIPGKDMLALAMDELRLAQYEIGGQVVFLECEDGIPYLRDIPWIGQFLFGSKAKRKNKIDIVLFVMVGEIDAEGPRGAVGAPAGAMNVVNDYPKGFNETHEYERSQSNER